MNPRSLEPEEMSSRLGQVTVGQFSNAELAIALLNPSLPYDPQALRLGAAMLSADGNTPEEIARQAEQ